MIVGTGGVLPFEDLLASNVRKLLHVNFGRRLRRNNSNHEFVIAQVTPNTLIVEFELRPAETDPLVTVVRDPLTVSLSEKAG
jgi:hypothetical protein